MLQRGIVQKQQSMRGGDTYMHNQETWMVKGLVLVVVGVLWWLTNYDILDAKLWDWLLPLIIVLLGLYWMMPHRDDRAE